MVFDGSRTSGGPERPPPTSSLEPLTDPGHAQPYESLYRSAGGPSLNHRTTLRHFQPLLSAPEEPEPGDVYRWLYRPEPDPAAPATDGSPRSEMPVAAALATEPGPGAPPAASARSAASVQPGASGQRAPRRSSAARRFLLGVLVVLLLLTTAAAAALWLDPSGLTRRSASVAQAPRAVPSPGATSAARSASAGAPVPAGASATTPALPTGRYGASVQPLPVAQVRVGCQAPDSVDDAGRRVRYSPELLTDGDPSTAWRCAGHGRGETVVFTLAEGARIAELGLLNGYAKVDPVSGDNRYGEYRRVRQVRWTFDDGSSVDQELRDRVEAVQTIRIPVRTAERITLTVIESTTAGSTASSRDAVLLSEATFAGPSS